MLVLPAAPAWGQSGGASGCGGGPGLMTADVTIKQPAANAVVSGKNVVVRASAEASLGQLSRMEVTLAGTTKVKTASPSSSIDFEAAFDVSNVPPGETSLQVVACGAFSLAGSLARGEAEITVRIQAPTTTIPTSRTTVVGAGGPGSGGTGGAVATTTSVAVTTTKAGQATSASSSTTVTSVASENVAAPPAAQPRAEPARPRASDAPLVLTEAPDDGSSGSPLWVGAVVGISGGFGLLFSARTSWRRGKLPEAAEALEPVQSESDLVDVT